VIFIFCDGFSDRVVMFGEVVKGCVGGLLA